MGDTADALLRKERAVNDEDTRAVHWAHFQPVPIPPEVVKARNGLDDLLGRREADDWRPLTRDERRLCRHYRAVMDAHHVALVEAYRNR